MLRYYTSQSSFKALAGRGEQAEKNRFRIREHKLTGFFDFVEALHRRRQKTLDLALELHRDIHSLRLCNALRRHDRGTVAVLQHKEKPWQEFVIRSYLSRRLNHEDAPGLDFQSEENTSNNLRKRPNEPS